MGKRGPLPMNLEKKWVRGTSATRGKSKRPPPYVPRMPVGLSEGEQSIWRRLVPRIAALKILDPADLLALVDLVRCIARLEDAERDISERGLLVASDRGKVKNPSAQLARQYREAVQKWAQRFGISPGDRERLDVPEPERETNEGEFERFLRRSVSTEDDPRRYLQAEAQDSRPGQT